jgi:hypothetical protein
MIGYIVGWREKSRSKHAVNGVSEFVNSRVYLDRESAEKTARRLVKVYEGPDWFLGMTIREVNFDAEDYK